jgi:adenine/guanine phosphoribosyltransferase-like PRPP-binding protein
VLVDFWNPFAVIAARAMGVPVVTVIQAETDPLPEDARVTYVGSKPLAQRGPLVSC